MGCFFLIDSCRLVFFDKYLSDVNLPQWHGQESNYLEEMKGDLKCGPGTK